MIRFTYGLILYLIGFFALAQDTYVPGEFVIKIQIPEADTEKSLTRIAIDNLDQFGTVQPIRRSLSPKPSILDGIYKVRVNDSERIYEIIDSLRKFSNVIYVEQIFREQLLAVPNDPQASPSGGSQGYLEVIRAYEAWDITKGSEDIVIGIIDTGSDLDHEDLRNDYVFNEGDPINGVDDDGNGYVDDYYGYDFADQDHDPTADGSQHGTHVTGIAGASTNNQTGIASTGYNSSIRPLKIFTTNGNNSFGSYEAVQYAADNGFDVINLSWGSSSSYSPFNQDIINYAVLEKDVVVIAAAGNTPDDIDFYPASYDNVLSVAATNLDDSKAGFSTWSRNVDLTAPGNAIYSTQNNNTYGTDNGTSHAAPQVAGTAALIKDIYPNLSAIEIMERIRVTSDDNYHIGNNSEYYGKLGKGRLNMLRALTEENAVSIRSTNPSVKSQRNDQQAFFGDTLSLGFSFESFLGDALETQVHFTSRDGHAHFISGSANLGFVPGGSTFELNDISLVLDEGVVPERTIEIAVELEDYRGYKDLQIFEITTSPDHLTLGTSGLETTIAGNGNIGYASDPYRDGVGIQHDGMILSEHVGLLITADSALIDNLPLRFGDGDRSDPFTTTHYIRPRPSNNVDHYAENTFIDASSGIRIEQESLAWDSLNALVFRYRLTNTRDDTLTGVSVGMYVDWDIMVAGTNRATSDFESMVYTANNLETLFAGISILDTSSFHSGLLDITELKSDNVSFGDSLKYALAWQPSADSIGFDEPADVTSLAAYHLNTVLPYSSQEIVFVLGADTSLHRLDSIIEEAKSRMEIHRKNTIVEETYYSCEGGLVTVTMDSIHLFTSDPEGLDTLIVGDTLIFGPVESDTIVYASLLEDSTSYKPMAIQIILLDEIADFRMEPDTLFIGDNDINLVQFEDQSLLPLTWQWDFGNGNQASGVQHPTSIYNEPGTYEVSLEVTNEQGCADTKTDSLIVLERPTAPTIEDIWFCPGDEVTITSNNDTLRLYANAESELFIYEGTEIELGIPIADTAAYISRLSDGVESYRTRVEIKQHPVSTSYEISPVLDSLGGNFGITHLNSENIGSVTWTLNDSVTSIDPEFVFEAYQTENLIEMEIITDEGCHASQREYVYFSNTQEPEVSDIRFCLQDTLVIAPGPGENFGFFVDSALTNPIFKGNSLVVSDLDSIASLYVANIDSILPGPSTQIEVEPVDFDFVIVASPDTLILETARSVQFSISEEAEIYSWWIDSTFVENSPAPTLFFDSSGVYQVVQHARHEVGCLASDTLDFVVLDIIPEIPLGLRTGELNIYPNPVQDHLIIDSQNVIFRVTAIGLNGHKYDLEITNNRISTTQLKTGAYVLQIDFLNGQSRFVKLIRVDY